MKQEIVDTPGIYKKKLPEKEDIKGLNSNKS
jgi:hypothetical protein